MCIEGFTHEGGSNFSYCYDTGKWNPDPVDFICYGNETECLYQKVVANMDYSYWCWWVVIKQVNTLEGGFQPIANV